MFAKLLAITANTFAETIRQPIFGVLTWLAAGWLVLVPALSTFSLESGGDNKIMKDVAFSTMLLYGLIGAVFSASSVITREIESFTVLTVVSKPVSRPLFIVGKYLGVIAAIAVGHVLLCLVFFMTLQNGVMESTAHKFDQPVIVLSIVALAISLAAATFGNFNYGWHFSTALFSWVIPLGALATVATFLFDRQWHYQPTFLPDADSLQALYAVVLVFLAVLILAAFAVALSTRFSQIATLTLCCGIYLLGLLSDGCFAAHAQEGLQYRVLAAVLPNFQFFWLGDAITQELFIAFEHVLRVAAYAFVYAAAILALAVSLFQTREVG